jgi:DNA-binding transcriptional LysR family regulator
MSSKFFSIDLSIRSCDYRRVTPARLRTFLAVVDTGSAKVAATQLGVTESAVSASMAALQRDVGAVLLERHGRGLALSDAGAVFADYARQILGLLDEGLAATLETADPRRGQIRIGAVPTAGEYLLPGLLAGFVERYPEVRVTVAVAVRDRVYSQLGDHQLDVVIGGRPPGGTGLLTQATRPNSLVVVGPATKEPTAAGTDHDGTPLESTTWLLREAGSGTLATTLALLEALQIRPPLLALGSHGAVVASAVLGLGVTLVSADAVNHLLASGRLRAVTVPGTPLDRPWHLVTGADPTPSTRLFVDHVTDTSHAGALAFVASDSGALPGHLAGPDLATVAKPRPRRHRSDEPLAGATFTTAPRGTT